MKNHRILGGVALALTLLLSFSAVTALAQGPIVAFLDNNTHAIAANSSQMLRFDYAVNNDTGEHPVTTITMVNGNQPGLGFEVWTADGLHQLAAAQTPQDRPNPIGRGTPQNVSCDTLEVSASGGCQSADLVWQGAFGATGTYFVNVINNNNSRMSYTLKIQGSGVSLGTAVASAPASAPVPAAAPAIGSKNLDDPTQAIAMSNQVQTTIPANGVAWYKFSYNASDHPTITLRLVNGNNSGVSFKVFAAENLNDWWDQNPTGRGMPQSVSCDTGAPAADTGCNSADLIWQGAFGSTGFYYVRVANGNNTASPITLTMSSQ